jgi:DNA polymerase-3 subunit delta
MFAQGQPITPAMVDLITTGGIEQSIFTMTDQLARRDTAGAMRTLKKLQEQGQDAVFIFSMVVRQFRLMIEIKSLLEERIPANIIAKKTGAHPFVVQNTSKQCKNFTNSQLKRALRKLLEIDRRLKTGRIHLRPREEEQYLLAIERILLSH